MTVFVRLLLLGALLASPGTHAVEDYDELFERAVEAVDFEFDRHWAYTETQVDSERVRVGRYDPRRPSGERWQLLTVDDRVPSEDEIEEYRKEKAHDHSDDGDRQVSAMIEPGSIKLIEDHDDFWLLGFDSGENGKEFMDSVDATIRVNRQGGHLEYVDLRSHSPIKPAFGIRIAKFITRLTFGPAGDAGPIVPLSTHIEVKGRAYLFVSFDEYTVSRNNDFEYVVD